MTITLDGTTGITTPTTSTTGEFVTSVTGFKNRIINGAMVIDQRNAGASITANDASYVVDRFFYSMTASSKGTSQQSTTAATGFTNSVLFTSSSAYTISASDHFKFIQKIEGFNVSDLAWGSASAQTVTLSFWIRSSLTGTFGGSISNSALNRSYPFTYTILSANTFEQKTITIAGDTSGTWVTNSGVGMWIFWGLGVGSTYSGTAGSWSANTYFSATGATSVVGTNGATWYITGVQLEKGSTATSFDYRSIGTELALCQRYFQKSYNQADAPGLTTTTGEIRFQVGGTGGESFPTIMFPVVMRTTPTNVFYSPNSGGANLFYNYSTSTNSTMGGTNTSGSRGFSGGPGATATSICGFHFTAAAEL